MEEKNTKKENCNEDQNFGQISKYLTKLVNT